MNDEFDYKELITKSTFLPQDCMARVDKDVFRTDRKIDFYYPNITDLENDLLQPNLAALVRILRVYAIEFPKISYVQGMNDIASPILYVMKEESSAYQVFRAVMSRQQEYFIESGDHTKQQLDTLQAMLQVADPLLHDQLGFNQDNAQLFFCYRWLLLLFKREVGFEKSPLILETIYASPTASYELFIALALLLTNRVEMMQFGSHFDRNLQYFSEKAGQHDVDALLDLADSLHQHFTRTPSLRADPRFQAILRNR